MKVNHHSKAWSKHLASRPCYIQANLWPDRPRRVTQNTAYTDRIDTAEDGGEVSSKEFKECILERAGRVELHVKANSLVVLLHP